MSNMCALVDAWLYAADPMGNAPPDEIVAHVSNCSRCRVGLIALFADRIGTTVAPVDRSCAAVEAEVPAFVDYERDHGLIAAARTFPHTWWHILVCPDCDELYRALSTLAAEPSTPTILGQEWQSGAFNFTAQLEVHPAVVRQFFRAARHLGRRWGAQYDDVPLSERRDEIGLIQVSLRQESADRLALVVRTRPPIQGIALLALGDMRYNEPLDPEGCAIFSGLTEELFSRDAESIHVTIQTIVT